MMGALIIRELRLSWHGRARLLPLLAYPVLLLLVCAFALDLGALAPVIKRALLLVVLTLTPLTLVSFGWREEAQSGVLVQLYLPRRSLLGPVWVRLLVQLLTLGLPLVLAILGAGALLLNVDVAPLLLPALLALPTLLALASLSGALTLTGETGGALPALLLLPLYVPALILMAVGASATDPAMAAAACWWLAALAVLSLGLLPFAIAAALRQALPSW